MTSRIFIGIDPGKSGGIACLNVLGEIVSVRKMPETDSEIYAVISGFKTLDIDAKALIERVSSSPQMGVVSAFSFGKGYGGLRMALTAAGIIYDEVSPQVWQRHLGCLSGGDKKITKQKAEQLFPSVRMTHAISDALLIADYARRFRFKEPT